MANYIGLMSGTSLDGVDGVLVSFAASNTEPMRVQAHRHHAFPASLKVELLALNSRGDDELHRAALAGNAVARSYADVVEALLTASDVTRSEIVAIGAHGQTVRHRPGEFDGIGYTLQLNAPALLAELTGIDVVADLRSRDVAAGGLGAPLVPAFHRAVFAQPGATVAVLNLGGIGNLTVLGVDGRTLGFDCGPGNALMDHWCEAHTGRAFDAAGAWAASGTVVEPLLTSMLAEPFFAMQPPRSTGRDLFNAAWLAAHLRPFSGLGLRAKDVQATLAELTARACADEVEKHAADATRLLVCGGGALNDELMRRIAVHLPGIAVAPTDRFGLPAMQVEACAFAWLARAFIERQPGNLTAVTGARGLRMLGGMYPARAAGEATV
ncbi:MAG: anhydro-N-acetylmuramic acid kinase [Pseudomonadota bacterium]|nr:anhydro-N-acetylmuramic acid kinase [Pseudomonadota bacterium]